MTTKDSVVTPQRFAQGISFKEWLTQIKVNKDLFEKYYGTAKEQLTQADMEFFKKAVHTAVGPAEVLVIAEDWCPDVYRGLPTIAALADASGMELRIFARDTNMDIMNEYLNQGKYQSVPVLVFYTKDHRYITHWTERPTQVTEEMTVLRAKTAEELTGKPDEEVRAETRKRSSAAFPHWQRMTIDDWKSIFPTHVH